MSDDDWGDGDTSDFAAKVSVSGGGDEWGDDGGASSGGGRGRGGQGGSRGRGGGGGGSRACHKCGEEGHMSRECPTGGGGGGGGGGPRACFKCGDEGHMSRECPTGGSGGGGGGGSRACHKCGEEGHMSRECPTGGGGGGGSRACFKCGEEGHMSRECPTGGSGGGGGGGSRACHKCGEEGHMSRECPTGGGGGGGSNKCYKCNEEGHISRDCPSAGERKEGDGENPDEKPKPYVPPTELEGDEAFADRKMYYEGSGINFQKYNEIKFEITGDKKVPSINSFEDMKLRPLLLANLQKVGYKTPTPIQKHASPQFMAGQDVMACAQTGSGKTCAFLLPIINTLLNNQEGLNTDTSPVRPECLILAPTRELAIQIGREARLYSQDSVLRTVVCYGGAAIFSQKSQLQAGCNIMVATPGRLKQFVNENIVKLDCVSFFVLDEADRMLDMGFMTDVKEIVEKMTPIDERVSGMFSATFPVGVQKAAAEFLKREYVFIVIGVVGGACTDVVQEFMQVERSEKRGKLLDILRESPTDEKVLVFCNAKKGADFLAASLSSQGISTTSIHGDRLQSQRELALREFTQGKRKVLVATAVAARGLDIPKVGMVVNYDLPNEIDEYVHRIGRTGRLGHTGKAISFYEESQDNALAANLVSILQGANQPVPDFFSGEADGYANGGSNGFASTDHRDRVQSYGTPKPVENDEGDWD